VTDKIVAQIGDGRRTVSSTDRADAMGAGVTYRASSAACAGATVQHCLCGAGEDGVAGTESWQLESGADACATVSIEKSPKRQKAGASTEMTRTRAATRADRALKRQFFFRVDDRTHAVKACSSTLRGKRAGNACFTRSCKPDHCRGSLQLRSAMSFDNHHTGIEHTCGRPTFAKECVY
jgi:hypothetical protein